MLQYCFVPPGRGRGIQGTSAGGVGDEAWTNRKGTRRGLAEPRNHPCAGKKMKGDQACCYEVTSSIDPLCIRGNATNMGDRVIRFFLHENRSLSQEKISFLLAPRLVAFPWCARGLFEILRLWALAIFILVVCADWRKNTSWCKVSADPFKEALSVLMLCVPVFIFTYSSSAL